MKIKTKISLMSFAVLVSFAISAAGVFYAMNDVTKFQAKAERTQNSLIEIATFRAQVRNLIFKSISNHLLNTESLRGVERERTQIKKRLLRLKTMAKKSPIALANEFDSSEVETLEIQFDQIDASVKKLTNLSKHRFANESESIRELIENDFELGFLPAVDNVIQTIQLGAKHESLHLEKKTLVLKLLISAAFLFNFVLVVSFAVHLSSSIVSRISELELAASKLTVGDFDIELPVRGTDEISNLASGFSHMAKSLAVAKDEIVQKQRLLAHSSKMAALGQMSAGVAHEINNPLAIIRGHGEKILRHVEDDTLEKEVAGKSGRTIVSSVQRIAGIVHSLKQSAELVNRDEMRAENCAEILYEVIAEWQPKIAQIGGTLKIDVDSVTTGVLGRRDDLRQVFSSLISNSLDAITDSGMEEKWVKVLVTDDANFLSVRVTDSGNGVPKDLQEKIMQPFFTTKAVGAGTGLGLSAAGGIVSSHGGVLYLDVENPKTSFVVRLPLVSVRFAEVS